jgi:murein DD-endopeptidase MepM/ murein hydrolase activator NlpD
MVFAAALLVSLSVPAAALMKQPTTTLVADSVPAKPMPGQTFQVSADAALPALTRDEFEALTYAQVLALKYAESDYTYSATSGAVRWPFPYSVPINDGFGPRSDGFHKGIDMMAVGGTPIYAIADGVATTATYDASGYGLHVVISHVINGANVQSLYSHMVENSSPIVAGQEIKVGDYLGLVGDTGYATAVHLHFEIHLDGVPIDPFTWLQANAV